MNIIKSDIVGSEHDVFWEDISASIEQMEPRPLLVIANHAEDDSVSVAQLQKMLDASGLSAGQYNIVLLGKGQQMAWHQLRHRLQPHMVFLVGVLPADLGVSVLLRLNEPNRFNDTIWLPTLSINDLAQHADVKKQLWVSGMKPLFVDKVFGELAGLPLAS